MITRGGHISNMTNERRDIIQNIMLEVCVVLQELSDPQFTALLQTALISSEEKEVSSIVFTPLSYREFFKLA
jgi:hypothetical protein